MMFAERTGFVRLLRWALAILVGLLLLPYLLVLAYLVVRPVSTPMLWRSLTLQRVERVWVPVEEMTPVLPLAVMVAEDGQFCQHHGIDFRSLRQAIDDADDFSDLRGASTITQQTAKNLFLWPGRSVVRKVLELPLALWIDLVMPKRRIMEIYLNIAEWGPNGEFGAQAGAQSAFGKGVRNLNAREAALMASLLPNPRQRSARRPSPAVGRLTGIYMARAKGAAPLAACLQLAPRPTARRPARTSPAPTSGLYGRDPL